MSGYLIVLLVAVGTTAITTPIVRRFAERFGVVVAPDERRVHQRPTATLGGAAMYLGFLAGMARILRVRGYLNSEMRGYPLLEGGRLYLVPVSAVMNGVAAPASVLSSKGKLEPREWVSDKEAFDRAAARLSAVKIRGGRLLLIRG